MGLVSDTDILEVFEFDLAVLIHSLLLRLLGLLHLINEASLNALLLRKSLLLVSPVLRLTQLDAVRQVQVAHHLILHLGDVGAARLLLQLCLVPLLQLELGLRLSE